MIGNAFWGFLIIISSRSVFTMTCSFHLYSLRQLGMTLLLYMHPVAEAFVLM